MMHSNISQSVVTEALVDGTAYDIENMRYMDIGIW